MKTLTPYLKPYRFQLIIGPVFKWIEAILELIVPLLIARMIDVGVLNQNVTAIWRYGLISLLLAATGMGCAYICQYSASLASQGFGTDLRNGLLRHILKLSDREVEQFGTASLTTRLTSDIQVLQLAVAMLIRLVVRAPFLSVGSLIMVFAIDVRLALIFVVVLPLFVLALWWILTRTLPLYQRTRRKLDHLTGNLLESLQGVRVIRAFDRSQARARSYDETNEQLTEIVVRAGRWSSLMNPLTTLILNGAIIALLWFGGMRIQVGRLTSGELVAMINYLGQMLVALTVVANLVILYTRAYASAQRVGEVLRSESSLQFPEGTTPPASQPPGDTGTGDAPLPGDADTDTGQQPLGGTDIDDEQPPQRGTDTGNELQPLGAPALDADQQLRGCVGIGDEQLPLDMPAAGDDKQPLFAFDRVWFRYGEGNWFLEDLSLAVPDVMSVALIGLTGSGKSTLARLLERRNDPDRGEIRLLGKPLPHYSAHDLHQHVHLVEQNSSLLSGTIRSNLMLGLPADLAEEQLWDALTVAQAAGFVRALDKGLDSPVSRGGRNFSGGQRQRLTIARGLLRAKKLLILDDSSSALDFATDARFRAALAAHPRWKKLNVLHITQRIMTARQSDLIVLLDDGELVAMGDHPYLLATSSLYQEIFKSQFSEGDHETA